MVDEARSADLREITARLTPVFLEAQELGFLGPEPVEAHIRHAATLAGRVGPPSTVLDLGAGAGVPGLVFATLWPTATVTLLDASARRTAFCLRAVETLALEGRVGVVRGRAEELGHDPTLREHFDLVAARSFGRPAVTAECGSAFVRVGGTMLVTEPPDDPTASRWPVEGLLGLGLDAPVGETAESVSSVVISKIRALEARFPRRTGIPAKRPLWT